MAHPHDPDTHHAGDGFRPAKSRYRGKVSSGRVSLHEPSDGMDPRSVRIWICPVPNTLWMGGGSLWSPPNAHSCDLVVVHADDSDDFGPAGSWQEFLVASRVGLCSGSIPYRSGRSRKLPQWEQDRRQLDGEGTTGYRQQFAPWRDWCGGSTRAHRVRSNDATMGLALVFSPLRSACDPRG